MALDRLDDFGHRFRHCLGIVPLNVVTAVDVKNEL
jgi:hypothetical protein